jgi:NitT/TauT family transport system substrate-binding protein
VEKVRIGSLVGPTGMGLVELMAEHSDVYDIHLVTSPDQLIPKILNGDVDVATIPSNLAAVLYNKGGGTFSIVATTAMGVLYVVGVDSNITSFEDLKNTGKTLYSSGQGATPEYVLNHVLEHNGITEQDITVRYLPQHADLANQIASGTVDMALLPEPFVSTVLYKNPKLSVIISLSDEWQKIYGMDMPMSVVVVQNDFIAENRDALQKLMVDYKQSVSFVTNNLTEASLLMENFDIIANKDIAVKAISRSALCFETGPKSQKILENYFEVLYKANPKSVGGKIPGEEIYYK